MRRLKNIVNKNKLLLSTISILFLIFIGETFDLHLFVLSTFFGSLVLVGLFFLGIIIWFFNHNLGKLIIKNIGILIITIIVLDFASLYPMKLKKDFIIKQAHSDSFKNIILDIEKYKNETGNYPEDISDVQKKYETSLSKKCFWGMCTEISYYNDHEDENKYVLRLCDEHDTGPFIFRGCGTDYCVKFEKDNYKNIIILDNSLKFSESLSCM